jgi:hypothetical protein
VRIDRSLVEEVRGCRDRELVAVGVTQSTRKARPRLIVVTKQDQDTTGDGHRLLMGELAERWMPDGVAFVVD